MAPPHAVTPTAPPGLYTKARLLSLDVAAGSIGGAALAARALRVSMPWTWYVALPLAVWAVYTLDHLLDAQRIGDEAQAPRHRFHHRHRVPLALGWLVASALTLILTIALLPPRALIFGGVMSLLVVGHLLMVRWIGSRTSPLLMKELGVAAIYTLGIWGLPLLRHGPALNAAELLPLAQFFALALMNLLIFSLFERRADARDRQTSLTLALGPRRTGRLIVGLFIAVLLASGGALWQARQQVLEIQSVLLLMAVTLVAIPRHPRWFARHERYRVWGDAVFLFPLPLWFIGGG